MNHTGNMIGALMAALIMTIPGVMCAEQIVHPLAGIVDSAFIAHGAHGTHPLALESNHWDPSELTMGKSCARQFAEKAVRGDFWGMVRVGLFCPSTVYSN
jgi:hypothetical protein